MPKISSNAELEDQGRSISLKAAFWPSWPKGFRDGEDFHGGSKRGMIRTDSEFN